MCVRGCAGLPRLPALLCPLPDRGGRLHSTHEGELVDRLRVLHALLLDTIQETGQGPVAAGPVRPNKPPKGWEGSWVGGFRDCTRSEKSGR